MIKLRGKTKLLNDICKAVEIYNARQTTTDFVAIVGNDVDDAVLRIEPISKTHISVYLERLDYKLYLYTGERTPWLAAFLGTTLEPGSTPAISCYGQTIELDGIEIQDVNFVGCTFNTLKRTDFVNCRFENCTWKDTITGSLFHCCTFVNSIFDVVTFQSGTIIGCEFYDSKVELFFQSSSNWENNKLFNDSEIHFQ